MRKLAFIGFVLALVFMLAGCKTGKQAARRNPTQPKASPMHAMSDVVKKQILRNMKDDVELLAGLRDDTSSLSKGFTGKALADLANSVATEAAAGRIKVRVFENSKYAVSFTSKKLAAITWIYTDRSYFIDRNSQKPISSPATGDKRFAIALVKEKGRWKIGQIMVPATSKKNP